MQCVNYRTIQSISSLIKQIIGIEFDFLHSEILSNLYMYTQNPL